MACAPFPVAVNVGNVTLANGNLMRGISIGVGSPVQDFAFMPNFGLNNSYLFDNQVTCGSATSAYCETAHGGSYNQSASQTSVLEPNTIAAGGSASDNQSTTAPQWLRDNLVLSDNTTVNGFPLAISRENHGDPNYGQQMMIGLNSNSTVLNALKDSGQILSRTWSMFWGLTGIVPSQQLNGSFVFGGYDTAKVQGANLTQPLQMNSQACQSGLLVSITDMNMRYPNGTTFSLFGGSRSTGLNACIDPGFPTAITMPYNYWHTFEEICQCETSERSFGVNFYGMIFDNSMPSYYGDLVLEIDNSLDITIPNSQLLQPDLSINSHGTLVSNDTQNELMINSLQQDNVGDIVKLGRQFMSAAMIMVNQDANTFTLWSASPNSAQSLVAVDQHGDVVNNFCAASTNTTASNSTSTTPPATPSPSPGLSTGAKAGIGIGAALGVLVVGLMLFSYLKKRKSRREPMDFMPFATYEHDHKPLPQYTPGSGIQGSGALSPAESRSFGQKPIQMTDVQPVHRATSPRPVELGTSQEPFEIGGSHL